MSASTAITISSTKKRFIEETKFSGELWLNPEVGNILFKISKPIKVLDRCCGTGVTSSHLQQISQEEGARDKVDLICGDLSEGQLAHVNRRIKENGWENAKAVRVNAMRMLTANGFVDVEVKLFSLHMPMHDAEDFADIYEAFIEMVTDKYWTEDQRQKYRPLIRNVVTTTINAKYGEGKSFTTERVAVMATARKP
ncbi:hypothetical protein G7Y89_g5880 [Cudoniella acicularis]|uniref:Methyltransferase domain-containing protein n=1 Tax=Cudoniella acicularis TaxID=354080 RepID=A0A8H4W627_9HELO|nr:hypothetical protein G7Y89_g5880 [Cudoniella acicularis]